MTALPNRRSIRLAHYDYRTAGGYFITICARDRQPLFADPRTARIVNAAWNDIPSHHAHVEIDEFVVMPNHLHGILFLGASDVKERRAQQAAPLQRSEPLVAPGALGVTDALAQQAAPLQRSEPRVAPGALGATDARARQAAPLQRSEPLVAPGALGVTDALARQAAPLQRSEPLVAPGALGATDALAQQAAPLQRSEPLVAPGALGAIIRSFKARVTRDLRAAMSLDVIVWQRNYHEHVIRDERSLHRIRQYIIDNPARWEFDRENPAGRPDQAEGAFADWLNGLEPHFATGVGTRQ